jgi:hypothetical protein
VRKREAVRGQLVMIPTNLCKRRPSILLIILGLNSRIKSPLQE